MALKKICHVCSNKIEYGTKCTCEINRAKEYNKHVRNSKDNIKYTKFYNSTQWKHMSDYMRTKYNSMCLMCLIEEGIINSCDVVHHIEEIRVCWDKRLDEDNLITLCHSCHNRLHVNYTDKEKNKCKRTVEKFMEKFY